MEPRMEPRQAPSSGQKLASEEPGKLERSNQAVINHGMFIDFNLLKMVVNDKIYLMVPKNI